VRWGAFARLWLWLGERLGGLAFLLGIRRPVALDGLARAFPEKAPPERRRIARAAYEQLGRSLAEIPLVRRLPDPRLEELVRFQGWEIYQRAQGAGRGVVVAIAHYGNFELLARACARRGVSLAVIVRTLRGGFNDWLTGDRQRTGVRHLADRGSSKEAVAVLRRNQVLAIAVDQNMRPSRGIFVDFFGEKACTTPAAAIYSLRTGAALLAAFGVRQADGTHLVQVRGPFSTALGGHAAVEDLTQQLTRSVEEAVRAHPDHWLWLHRRWKTRPG
jgi:Kdo2-lipid IVA lauroyltransferase/acyltransferase